MKEYMQNHRIDYLSTKSSIGNVYYTFNSTFHRTSKEPLILKPIFTDK